MQTATVTTTTDYQQLSALLEGAGLSSYTNGAVTAGDGYIKNASESIVVTVATGSASPGSAKTYVKVGALSAVIIPAGTNLNTIWVKCASSTADIEFADGAAYQAPNITGVIGTITVAEDVVPKADADGNLVASSISDDGTTVTADADLEVTGDSTLTGTLTTGASIVPSANDGGGIGDATHSYSDLFLASGANVNFNNGNVVLTQSSGILTMGTGELRITTPGTNGASVPTLSSTSTLSNKTLVAPALGTVASGDVSACIGASVSSKLATTVTYNDTASLANTALSVTVAAGTYLIQIMLNSTAAVKGLKTDFAGTAVISSAIGQWWQNCASATDTPTKTLSISALGTDFDGFDAGSPHTYMFTGSVVVGTGGTILLRGAQNAADASDTTILAGSWMLLTRVA